MMQRISEEGQVDDEASDDAREKVKKIDMKIWMMKTNRMRKMLGRYGCSKKMSHKQQKQYFNR